MVKTLFIGSSGIGKTTLADTLDCIDMDDFGFMNNGKWTICLKCLKYRLIDNETFFGICHNLKEVAKLFDVVVLLKMDVCLLYSNILKRHYETIGQKQRSMRSKSRIENDIQSINNAFQELDGVVKLELDCNFPLMTNMRNIVVTIERLEQ